MNNEQLSNVNQNLLTRALKINIHHIPFFFFFSIDTFSLHHRSKEFVASIKATVHTIFISITCALLSINFLADFKRLANWISFLELHMALCEIFLTAYRDQLSYNLSLIKLCSACVKQKVAVKTAS